MSMLSIYSIEVARGKKSVDFFFFFGFIRGAKIYWQNLIRAKIYLNSSTIFLNSFLNSNKTTIFLKKKSIETTIHF